MERGDTSRMACPDIAEADTAGSIMVGEKVRS
jgi:hypothetical protein